MDSFENDYPFYSDPDCVLHLQTGFLESWVPEIGSKSHMDASEAAESNGGICVTCVASNDSP
jgi:hypothetical protein